MRRYSRFGQEYHTLTSSAIVPVSVDYWFAMPQDIRQYMTSKDAAINFAKSTLNSFAAYARNILARGATAYDYSQAQYVVDQMVLLQAIDQYLFEKYQTGILADPSLSSIYSRIVTLDASGKPVSGLVFDLMKLNPDVGQLVTLQNILKARKAAGQDVSPVNFVPQFSTDKSPILVTPDSGVPGSLYPSGTEEPAKQGMGIGTIALLAIGGIVAYNAFK